MSDLKLPSINRVVIAGRLTSDPQLKYTQKGTAVVRMRLASNRNYKNGDGEWQQEVSYLNVIAWAKLAENCGEYLSKGSAVYVEGRLKSQEWEDSEGNKKSSLDVHADNVQFLDKAGSNGEGKEEDEEEEEEKGDLPF
jgi:single-strand DNA-binding protein